MSDTLRQAALATRVLDGLSTEDLARIVSWGESAATGERDLDWELLGRLGEVLVRWREEEASRITNQESDMVAMCSEVVRLSRDVEQQALRGEDSLETRKKVKELLRHLRGE